MIKIRGYVFLSFWKGLGVGKCGLTFLTPPLSFTTTTSRGESLRPCQQRRKFLPILPNPLMATLSFASVLRLTLPDLVAC